MTNEGGERFFDGGYVAVMVDEGEEVLNCGSVNE